MRFDAYKASLPRGTDAEQVINHLAMQQPLGELTQGKPRFGYQACTVVRDGEGERWVDVLHGGTNGVLVETYGEGTPGVVDLIRSAWPNHAVTRADVCRDIIEDTVGVFDRLTPVLDGVVRDHGRVRASGIIPRVRASDGATYTIGSRTSETYFRIYQKPEQLLAEGLADQSIRILFDRWVRLELEAKPQKDNRYQAAFFQPEEFFGLSRIARSVADEVLQVVVEKNSVVDYKLLGSKERERRFMLKQCQNILRRWQKDVGGSRAGLGIAICDALDELDRSKKR